MSIDFLKLINPQISSITPYVPGKPVSELQRELGLTKISKLASNENPLGASSKVKVALEEAMKEISRYPDGSAYSLRQTLAEFLKVDSSQITLGNGSNELLEFVGRVFAGRGDEIVYSQYGFAVYPITAQIVNATGVEVKARNFGHDLVAMAKAITDKTKIVYVANPNNPTGTSFDKAQWETFMAAVPQDVLVVLDEAYLEYVERADYPNGLDYLKIYPNLIVSRTFSKAYGLASLRVGYMVSSPEIADYLNRIRAAFNTSHQAQVAAEAAIKDQAFVKRTLEENKQGMRQIVEACKQLRLDFIPSEGNFVCIAFPGKAMEINQKLLQHGVIVRPLANYGMTDHLRVSIGSKSENQHFIDSLRQVLK